MATNRTGTGKWKSIRRRAIKRAQREGLTHCPMRGCGRALDYTNPYRPESAEADHIISVADGGEDSIHNARVICRDCNVRRHTREKTRAVTAGRFPTSRTW